MINYDVRVTKLMRGIQKKINSFLYRKIIESTTSSSSAEKKFSSTRRILLLKRQS